MRLSISITSYSWRDVPLAAGLLHAAQAADDGGLDTVWVPDHVAQVDPTVPDSDDELLEAWSALAFLAARTSRVRLGTLVTNVALRPPALLLTEVATLAALSGGRAWLGIGAGYGGREVDERGLPDVPTGTRFEQLEETVRAFVRIRDGDSAPVEGRHVRFADPRWSPRPVGVPLLVGGTGERRTLRLVAGHADACNVFDLPDDGQTVRHKLSVLEGHCAEVGRPYSEISKTLSTRLAPGEDADGLARRCERVAGWGIDHLVFVSSSPWADDALDVITGAARQVQDV